MASSIELDLSGIPKSMKTFPFSTLFTMPNISWPILGRYISTTLLLSASLTFWTITFFAAIATILPNSIESISSS